MLRVSLSDHNPIDIHNYFRTQVGNLQMLIKNEFAILKFVDPSKNDEALKHYHNVSIKGFRINLTRYNQPDKGQLNANQEYSKPHTSFNQLLANECDPFAKVHLIITNHQTELKQIDKKYASIESQAIEKLREIRFHYPKDEDATRYSTSFFKLLDNKLNVARTTYTNNLINITQSIRRFNRKAKKEVVDLNPNFGKMEVEEISSFNSVNFEQMLKFVNNQGYANKRLIPLDHSYFACTQTNNVNQPNPKGKLKIFSLNLERATEEVEIPEVPYGLAKMNSYILIGNLQGTVNWMNLSFLEGREVSKPLHRSAIFEVLNLPKPQSCPVIITAGRDNTIKSWKVEELQITDDLQSLEFKLLFPLESEKEINAVQIYEDNSFMFSIEDKIYIFNCDSQQVEKKINAKHLSFCLKKIDQNTIATAKNQFISIFDVRQQNIIQQFLISKVRTLTRLTQDLIFYGTAEGEVGVLDRRNLKQPVIWKDEDAHKGSLSISMLMKNCVLTGDRDGAIIKWGNLDYS